MKIHYISESSSLKKPIQFQKSGVRFINNGDICIKANCNSNSLKVLFINDSDANWSQCSIIGTSITKPTHDPGNTLLFSYDGINKRSGNLGFLIQLSDCFSEDSSISKLLKNAIKILKYQEDSFDFDIISKIMVVQNEISSNPQISEKAESNDAQVAVPLSPFLPLETNKILFEYLKSGMSLYESYNKIRETHKRVFIQACMEFASKYPGKSIY